MRHERHHLLGLVGRQPRRRLVEQQEARRRRERDGQLELPLLAVGDLAGRLARLLAEPHLPQHRERPRVELRIAVGPAPREAAPGLLPGEGRQPDIVQERQRGEDAGALERARDAEMGDRRAGGVPAMSRPSKMIRPDVGASCPVSRLKNVVLPAPLGPMTECSEPGLDLERDRR